ncbi:hypothetical protein DNTS_006564 [Danionella cerebrum]|uniref:Ribosome receptor lysine/proline rich domain-containing protein n=1 Tax=Danionella cerebrum TaxID=2873325 RepID=A0A553NAC2_9TELE|nr:hypothetical protein DNTS_006564 [Danionella translucida]
MDVYDPQTLGIVVFGGFMVFSAIGITLVSTFSMKETSYEEALAKQRQDSSKSQQQRSDKKKKVTEKKGKAKKKDEKPNGNVPQSEPESLSEPVVDSSEPLVQSEPQPQTLPNPEPEPEVKPKPIVSEPASKSLECAASPTASTVTPPLAPSPKEKKKKKVAKVEPAPIKPVEVVVPEVVVKVEPVVPEPVAVKASVAPEVSATPKAEEPKAETATKKKTKKKTETVVSMEVVDVPQPSPYKALVSSLNRTSFTESEIQKLFEIISKKVGKGNSWQLASQKGDPLAALKKQLEDKDKQLTAEQGNLESAKTRVRELTKELNSAKSKMTSVETRMSSELSARGQEIAALQARMQTSYQEHANETQQLKSKVQTLQEQLENGPKAQLARLEQENTILRDALNQATSQAESRQNAEVAKLRQDCVRLNRELTEHKASQNGEDDRRKSLEIKLSAVEEQLAQTQEAERSLQEKLNSVSKEFQEGKCNLQTQIDAAKVQAKTLDELQERLQYTETELKNRCEELETLRAQVSAEKPTAEMETIVSSEEVEQLRSSLREREEQLTSLEVELTQMREELDAVRRAQAEEIQNRVNEADTQCREYTTEIDQLKASLKEKEDLAASLQVQLDQMESSVSSEAEPAFENLEKDARMISLEEELQKLKEEMEQTKAKSSELREKNYTAVEALAAAERLGEERLSQAKAAQNEVEQQLSSFQTQTKNAFQTLFPHISIETQKTNWLEALTHEAQKILSETHSSSEEQQHTVDSSDLMNLEQKLVLSEESQRSLQAECEKYRSTLSETESMLKLLQKSVEDGELAWNSKIAESEEQKQAALDQVKVLEETIEKISEKQQDADKLKEQVMLLEAQLEKQLESITVRQTHAEEVAELKTQLSETRLQLMAATAELSLVQTQLEESKQEEKIDESPQRAESTEEVQKYEPHPETPTEELKPDGEETEEPKEAEEVKEGTSV